MKKMLAFLLAAAWFGGFNPALGAGDFTVATANGIPLRYAVNGNSRTVTLTGHGNPCRGDLVIPDSITYKGTAYTITAIGKDAFMGCRELISVVIPNTVVTIDGGAFFECSGMKALAIGSAVTSIGGSAFELCDRLTSLIIPNSVDTINKYAFYGCGHLTTVTLGASVALIDHSAFSGCTKLESIHICAARPPKTQKSTFQKIPSKVSLTVPIGARPAYSTAEWAQFVIKEGECPISDEKGTEGVAIYADSCIYVQTDTRQTRDFHVYDLTGRTVVHITDSDRTPPLPAGTYMVKVGTLPAKKVVVTR